MVGSDAKTTERPVLDLYEPPHEADPASRQFLRML